MDMVCKTLSEPDQYGLQACLQWGEYTFYSDISAHLTFATANQLLAQIAVAFTTVFIIKRVAKLLGIYY